MTENFSNRSNYGLMLDSSTAAMRTSLWIWLSLCSMPLRMRSSRTFPRVLHQRLVLKGPLVNSLYSLYLFKNLNKPDCLIRISDIFASPDYPKDGVPHFGFPVFKESLILYVNTSLSERNKQDVAFLMAKTLSEFVSSNPNQKQMKPTIS